MPVILLHIGYSYIKFVFEKNQNLYVSLEKSVFTQLKSQQPQANAPSEIRVTDRIPIFQNGEFDLRPEISKNLKQLP